MITPGRRPKSLRLAVLATLVLPGAGQFYLGQVKLGIVFAASFLTCFIGMLAIFVRGYLRYLDVSSGGDILGADQLEQIARSFHIPALISLSSLSVVIFVVALSQLVWSWWRQKLADAQVKLQTPSAASSLPQ